LSAAHLDEVLSNEILSRLLTDHNLDKLLREANEAASSWITRSIEKERNLSARCRELERANNKIFETIETHGADSDVSVLLKRINRNESEIQSITVELKKIECKEVSQIEISKAEIAGIRKYLYRIIKSETSVKKARSLFSSILQRVVVNNEEAVVYYRPEMLFKPKGFAGTVVWLPVEGLLRTKCFTVRLPDDLCRKVA